MTNDLTAQHRVTWLIRTLEDAKNDYGEASTGAGVRLMPSGYHEGSYAELERVEAMLHMQQPVNWWHVLHRFRFGDTQTVELVVRVRPRKTGLVGDPYDRLGNDLYHLPAHCELTTGQVVAGKKTARVRVYRWDPHVDMGRVRAGVRWITQQMYDGRRSRIQLPDDLYRRVLGLPPRDERLGKRVRVAA